jgi:hypothetical protein
MWSSASLLHHHLAIGVILITSPSWMVWALVQALLLLLRSFQGTCPCRCMWIAHPDHRLAVTLLCKLLVGPWPTPKTKIVGIITSLPASACSFGWWLMAGADLLWEKGTVGWLMVAGLFWEKSSAGWWLISRTNRLCLKLGLLILVSEWLEGPPLT